MPIIATAKRRAGRIAGDVQTSVRRARLEAERRTLERRRRHALTELGRRTAELVAAGSLPDDALGPELATVNDVTMLLAAHDAEIAALQGSEPPG
jgi:hypothetical protein